MFVPYDDLKIILYEYICLSQRFFLYYLHIPSNKCSHLVQFGWHDLQPACNVTFLTQKIRMSMKLVVSKKLFIFNQNIVMVSCY